MAINLIEFDFEIMLQQSLEAISREKNGLQAIKVLHILSYFSSQNVPIDIFTTIMGRTELETALEQLKQFLLIHSSNRNDLINVNKLVQKRVRTLLREAKKDKSILKEAVELLLQIEKNSEKFDLVIDHGICVWLHMHNCNELLRTSSALPGCIVASLIRKSKYKEANSFVWEALKLLKHVLENDNIEVLKLEFQFANLLEMSGRYREAMRLLMPLFIRDVTDVDFKNKIFNSVISVMKNLQDTFQYEEVLPIYEKLLSGQKVAEISNEEILTVWHHYAILLSELEKYKDSIEILEKILNQKSFSLKYESLTLIKTSIANVYLKQMKYNKALELYTEILAEQREVLGEGHIDIFETKKNVISLLQKIGKNDEAIKMREELVAEYEKAFDKNNPELLLFQVDLAMTYYIQNEYEKAAKVFNRLYNKQKGILTKTTDQSLSAVKYKTCNIYNQSDIRVFNDDKPLLLTNFETVQSMVDNDIAQIYTLIQDGFDINFEDNMGNTLLHYAAKSDDLNIIRLLLQFGLIYNSTNKEGKTPSQLSHNNDTKTLFNLVSELFTDVKTGNIEEANKCIEQERCIVNAKDKEGFCPLHWAALKGYTSILKILLEAGANATCVSNKGNTPLHIATSKGFCRIADVLLQAVKYDKLNDFINAQTLGSGSSALHIAAKDKSWRIVRTLLKFGAIFNIKNSEGKTPLEISEDQTEDNVFRAIQEIFHDAQNGNVAIIQKLKDCVVKEWPSIFNARNEQGMTVIQVLMLCNHKKITFESLQILKSPYELKPWESFEGKLEQLAELAYFAKVQLDLSNIYISMLNSIASPSIPDTNTCPWKSVKEGSYLLGNASNLVECYQKYYPTTMYDAYILKISNILEQLQFESEHKSSGFTEEVYNGKVECFVSKGQGTKYYNLLHSYLRKDIRYFIDLIDINIDIPTVKFLQSIIVPLQSLYSEALFKAIQNKNLSVVEKYLKRNEAFINLEVKGMTPLSYCVEQGDIKTVKLLLENGADVTQMTVRGDTTLHIATSKRYKTIVEHLLRYTPPHKLNAYVNCTNSNGSTPLHIAAKNDYVLIARVLLKYGAIYCKQNKKGKTPLELASKLSDTNRLLQLTHQCFQHAQNGSLELSKIVNSAKGDELKAVTNAENMQGCTLLDVIEKKYNKIMYHKLQQTMDRYMRNNAMPKLNTKRTYEKIRDAAWLFYQNSQLYECRLQHMSRYYQHSLHTDSSPWNVLKEGSMYLFNAHRFVEECKFYSGYGNDRYVLKIIKTLESLEFDPNHISWGYRAGGHNTRDKSFVSLGEGAMYYKMLSSNSKTDVEDFMCFVQVNIYDSVTNLLSESGHSSRLLEP